MQICKYANIQICKYANMQKCKNANVLFTVTGEHPAVQEGRSAFWLQLSTTLKPPSVTIREAPGLVHLFKMRTFFFKWEHREKRDVIVTLLLIITSSAGPSSWEEVAKWRFGRLQHHFPHWKHWKSNDSQISRKTGKWQYYCLTWHGLTIIRWQLQGPKSLKRSSQQLTTTTTSQSRS